jgi:hypothetical protein
LTVRTRDLRAVRDVPAPVPFHYCGELVPHASCTSAPSVTHCGSSLLWLTYQVSAAPGPSEREGGVCCKP